MIEIPKTDSESLARRIKFLRSRVDAHLKANSNHDRSKACAATLLLDAACGNLLLGEIKNARKDLAQSGTLFLDLGSTRGAVLIALSGGRNARETLEQYDFWAEGVPKQSDRSSSIAGIKHDSTYQIFSHFQAKLLMGKPKNLDKHEWIESIELIQHRLENLSNYPVGSTGLSIREYIHSAVGLARVGNIHPLLFCRSLELMYRIRQSNIDRSMEDLYHWRMFLRPAQLLDLDTVILMYFLLYYTPYSRHKSYISSWGDPKKDGSIYNAPLIVAQNILLDQDRSTVLF